MNDLPRSSSGNGAQRILDVGRHPSVMAEGVGGRDLRRRRSVADPDNQPVEHAYKLIRAHDLQFHRPAVRRQLLELASGAANVRRTTCRKPAAFLSAMECRLWEGLCEASEVLKRGP